MARRGPARGAGAGAGGRRPGVVHAWAPEPLSAPPSGAGLRRRTGVAGGVAGAGGERVGSGSAVASGRGCVGGVRLRGRAALCARRSRRSAPVRRADHQAPCDPLGRRPPGLFALSKTGGRPDGIHRSGHRRRHRRLAAFQSGQLVRPVSSPRRPVRASPPEPGMRLASTTSTSPPAAVQQSPTATPGRPVRPASFASGGAGAPSIPASTCGVTSTVASSPSARRRTTLAQTEPSSTARRARWASHGSTARRTTSGASLTRQSGGTMPPSRPGSRAA